MRIRRHSWTIGALIAFVAATASAADPVRIEVRSPEIRRGQAIDLTCAWEHPPGFAFAGRLPVWCKFVNTEGRTLAFVRRTLTISYAKWTEPEYRFHVRTRVPRSADGPVRVDVLVHNGPESALGEFVVEAKGSIPLFENVARPPLMPFERFVRFGEKSRTWTGKLIRVGAEPGFPVVDVGASPTGADVTVPIYGNAAALVMRNPAWEGATVTVTGAPLMWGGVVVDFAPQILYAEQLAWQDPVAHAGFVAGASRLAVGALHSRIPPADLLANPLAWRSLLATTRTPRTATSAAERDALVADLRPALAELGDPLASIEQADMTKFDIVCLFTGTTPNHGWRVTASDISRDDRTQTTYVNSIVVGPDSNAAQPADYADAFAAYAIPKLPGTIRVLRDEWLPDRPAWW